MNLTGRYEVNFVGLDGNERTRARFDSLHQALDLRDTIRDKHGSRYGTFHVRVLDSEDYERGDLEWPGVSLDVLQRMGRDLQRLASAWEAAANEKQRLGDNAWAVGDRYYAGEGHGKAEMLRQCAKGMRMLADSLLSDSPEELADRYALSETAPGSKALRKLRRVH